MARPALLLMILPLGGCGVLCWHDPHGLDPPPAESRIPKPHA